MGAPVEETGRRAGEDEHQVTLTRDYWMMTTEVTQRQFQEVVGYNPSFFTACGLNCPVDSVSWHEFAVYANELSRLEGLDECYSCTGRNPYVSCSPNVRYATAYDCPGYRLPTEAEWEYAARAGTTTATYGGELDGLDCAVPVATLDRIAWYCGNSLVGYLPAVVCSSWGGPPGNCAMLPAGLKIANEWGLYDMLGNVWEWCHDWYGAYAGGPETDPIGAHSGLYRVLRGGSFGGYVWDARAAFRSQDEPSVRVLNVGGRIVRSRQ